MNFDDEALAQYDDSRHADTMVQEHRRILELIDLLQVRERAGASHAELVAILQQLELRTIEHFRNEEDYMLSIGYCGFASHQRIHMHLLSELARRSSAYQRAGGPLPASLVAFLRDWLGAHIGDNHKKHAGFVAMSRRTVSE